MVSDGDEESYAGRGGLSKRKKKKRRHRSVQKTNVPHKAGADGGTEILVKLHQ